VVASAAATSRRRTTRGAGGEEAAGTISIEWGASYVMWDRPGLTLTTQPHLTSAHRGPTSVSGSITLIREPTGGGRRRRPLPSALRQQERRRPARCRRRSSLSAGPSRSRP